MMQNQQLFRTRYANRYRIVILKGLIILAFILLAELRTCSAMTLPVKNANAIARADSSRKKTTRVRQRQRKQQHAVVNACSYKRKNKQRPVGFSHYR
jgi:hypothetical protein